MPVLNLKMPDGSEQSLQLVRAVTSVGSAKGNALVVADASVADWAFHIENKGDHFALAVLPDGGEVLVNGKKRDEATLAFGDVIRVGDAEIRFSEKQPAPEPAPKADGRITDVDALNKLVRFSESLLGNYELDRLLEKLYG
jgi:hypothetical protein